jgi:hypothetical protein
MKRTAMPAEIPSRQVAQPGDGCEVTRYVTEAASPLATALRESSGKGRSLIVPGEDGVDVKPSTNASIGNRRQ